MLALKDFKEFLISNTIKVKGGKEGVINGSSIAPNGDTAIDVSYDDGTQICEMHTISQDGSSDDLIGSTINH